MAYRPTVSTSALMTGEVPSSFGKLWQDAFWRDALVDWADQQPDWSGHLVSTLTRIEAFRAEEGATMASGAPILHSFFHACPPLDITLYRALRREVVSDPTAPAPASLFDRVYVAAYGVLTANPHVMGAFRAAIAAAREDARRPPRPGEWAANLEPIGPASIWG
jgi:hypothetical protein